MLYFHLQIPEKFENLVDLTVLKDSNLKSQLLETMIVLVFTLFSFSFLKNIF